MNYLEEVRMRQMANNNKRKIRLKLAREKSTHTKEEWIEMVLFFECICVRCFCLPDKIEKDHVIPLYQGGSDGLDNLQPLCQKCNRGKGSEDFDWRESAAQYLKKELSKNYKRKEVVNG